MVLLKETNNTQIYYCTRLKSILLTQSLVLCVMCYIALTQITIFCEKLIFAYTTAHCTTLRHISNKKYILIKFIKSGRIRHRCNLKY